MRLYLPRVEARLRGITALKAMSQVGNLHTTHVIHMGKRYIVGLQSPLHTITWIKHYNIQIQSRSDYGTKIKEEPQMRQGPRSTPTGLHCWSTRTKQYKGQDLHRGPPWAWLRHLHGLIGTCIWFLEVICESRGLSNLTPSRSRLFKLMGRKWVMRWSYSKH